MKELLFSITAKDCAWDFYRGSGPGGQKKNKTSSACRCTHTASGAVGQAEDTRSQAKNKQLAFKRMATTDTFQAWARLEIARVTGKLKELEDRLDIEMRNNIKIEIKIDGKWVEAEDSPAKHL